MKFLLGYLLAMVVGAGGVAWIVLSTVHAQTSMPTPWAFIPAPIETSYLPPTTFMAVTLSTRPLWRQRRHTLCRPLHSTR
jgi:hypothetical protein